MSLHQFRQPIAALEQTCKVGQTSAAYPILDRGLSLLPLICSGLALSLMKGVTSNFNFATTAIGLGIYGGSETLCIYLKEKVVPSIETNWIKSFVSAGLEVLDFVNDQVLLATLSTVAPTKDNSHLFTAINTATFFDTLPALIKNFEKDLTVTIKGGEAKYEINGLKICQSSLITALATLSNEYLQDLLKPLMPTINLAVEKSGQAVQAPADAAADAPAPVEAPAKQYESQPTANPLVAGLAEPTGYALLDTLYKVILTNENFAEGSLKDEFFNGFVEQGVRTLIDHTVGLRNQNLYHNFKSFAAVSVLKKAIQYSSNTFTLDSCTLSLDENILLSEDIAQMAINMV
jgi:hypothetical protein